MSNSWIRHKMGLDECEHSGAKLDEPKEKIVIEDVEWENKRNTEGGFSIFPSARYCELYELLGKRGRLEFYPEGDE